MAVSIFTKDPDAVLDYKFDWSNWLESDETISSAVVTVSSGITKNSDSITDSGSSVTVWLSGGTQEESFYVSCKIVTSKSRTDERTMEVRVKNR